MSASELGIIEGFYGQPWSWGRRQELIDFMARTGYETYMYAPKFDPYHRECWRDPYPADILGHMAALVERGRLRGVEVGMAISPGLSIGFSEGSDVARLEAKLATWQAMGVRLFGLLFDDIDRTEPDDVRARHQAELVNRMARFVGADTGRARLIFCPTDYHGTGDGAYHATLGKVLLPQVGVYWTGPDVVSVTITAADLAAVTEHLRRPVILWDNYPVHDALDMMRSLHLGPIQGRSGDVVRRAAGSHVNPMELSVASRVPLRTYRDFWREPERYDPFASYRAACRVEAPAIADALILLGEVAAESQVDHTLEEVAWPDAGSFDAWERAAEAILAAPADGIAGEVAPWALKLREVARLGRAVEGGDPEAIRAALERAELDPVSVFRGRIEARARELLGEEAPARPQ